MNSKNIIGTMQAVAMDSINKAGQGHSGMAIGAAPITYPLIGENLSISKTDPKWINRDRFILSAGHGSMSFYSIMHLLGLLSIEDMESHKCLHSKTPSHPEKDAFDYVDASTGPLGQGIAMGVGMAISAKYLAKKFNTDEHAIINHDVFVLHGDGCIQEGVALEAIQLAGTKKLSNLIMIHDFNGIQIDSASKEVNNIDFVKYMEAQGFDTFVVSDPSVKNINKAISDARLSCKPSYIQVKTKIATLTKNEGTTSGHNFILSPMETEEFKKKIGIKSHIPFEYGDEVYQEAQKLWSKKTVVYNQWLKVYKDFEDKYPEKFKRLNQIVNHKGEFDIKFVGKEKDVATRNYLVNIMKQLSRHENMVVGSADLAGATKVSLPGKFIEGGNNIQFGIREFSMTAINNGIYLHSGIRTIDSTFLSFADYAKPAIRLGAIMNIPSIHVYTHDSYQVGGDGPTHQPVEQLAMLRASVNTEVIRPCDESEVVAAFNYALNQNNKQVCIIFCRQPIKSFNLNPNSYAPAYKIKEEVGYDLSILATGSEVSLAVESAKVLKAKGIKAQVISVPNLNDLISQPKLIKKLGINKKPMYAIEASSDSYWFRLSKYNKIDAWLANGFGYSAPGDEVYSLKGFNVKNITKAIEEFLKTK